MENEDDEKYQWSMKEMKMKSNIVKTQSKNKVPLKECNKGTRISSTLLSMIEKETLQ